MMGGEPSVVELGVVALEGNLGEGRRAVELDFIAPDSNLGGEQSVVFKGSAVVSENMNIERSINSRSVVEFDPVASDGSMGEERSVVELRVDLSVLG